MKKAHILLISFLLLISCIKRKNDKNYFNLENINSLSPVKKQSWGTCWAHAAIRSIESNLLHSTGISIIDLSEYHMDKYSGFTRDGHDNHLKSSEDWYRGQGSGFAGSNTDDPTSGLIVHLGGDLRMAASYLSLNGGAVVESKNMPKINGLSNDFSKFGNTKTDGIKYKDNYVYYMPKHIEWLSLNKNSKKIRIQEIKDSIKKYGAVSSSQFFENNDELPMTKDGKEIHLNPKNKEVNHAINLVGWDDDFKFKNYVGAWIAEDSDHVDKRDKKIGQFYIPYEASEAIKNDYMGAVSFKDVIRTNFSNIYSHSLHGWRYTTTKKIDEVISKYKINKNEKVFGVGIYTTVENESGVVSLRPHPFVRMNLCFKRFQFKNPGFHLIELDCPRGSEEVYVIQKNNSGKYAFDASFRMDVLLNSDLPPLGEKVFVNSKANPNESFYMENGLKDFSMYKQDDLVEHARINNTANIAMSLYTVRH